MAAKLSFQNPIVNQHSKGGLLLIRMFLLLSQRNFQRMRWKGGGLIGNQLKFL